MKRSLSDRLRPRRLLRGVNAQIELYEDRLVFRWTGLVTEFYRPTQRVYTMPLTSLKIVELDRGGFVLYGHLRCTTTRGRTALFIFRPKEFPHVAAFKNELEALRGTRPRSSAVRKRTVG